jgi:5'-deoxynucleotidase YfbR-like HD superfamily hydrolase
MDDNACYDTAEAQRIIDFLKYAEGLKTEPRDLNLSTGEPETVASHCWRMALMVMLVGPKLAQPADMERMLKLALVHDLVEIEAGDVPVFKHFRDGNAQLAKHRAETAAMDNMVAMLNGDGGEIKELWEEYEEQLTFEARVVKAIDKLEARFQFHMDPKRVLSTHEEKLMTPMRDNITKLSSVDPILAEMDRISRGKRKNPAPGDDGYSI